VDINTINKICSRLYGKTHCECNKTRSYEGVMKMDGHSIAVRDLTRSRGEYDNIYTEHNGKLWLSRLLYVVMC
jgi:hypothetical protein